MERGNSTPEVVRLLDWDPDLAQDLGEAETREAHDHLLVRLERLDWKRREGIWGKGAAGDHLGLLLVEGLLLRRVTVPGGGAAEVLGFGDLIRPWDVDGEEELAVSSEVRWTVLSEVTVALLDIGFIRRACRWPPVLSRLSARGVLRAKGTALNQAISHLKHVENRLLLLLWHFAERWGRVSGEAITLELPITHELLGRLVGATRPSVTTALGRLERRGLLERRGDVWRISRDSAEEFRRGALLEPGRPMSAL